MFILYGIILIFPFFLLWLHLKREEEDAKVGVPGPKGWPLLGAIFEIKPYVKTLNFFQKFHDYHEVYGDTYQIRLGPVKMIISRDPKITEAIVKNPKFGKSREYELLKAWLGDSLVISEGEKWNKMRKLLTPAFHFQNLERFIAVFEEQVGNMIENIRREIANPNAIDVCPMFHALTLDIISETSMGVSLNAQLDAHSSFIDANNKLLTILDKRAFSGYLTVEWIFRLSPLYKIQADSIAFINEFVDRFIEERRKKLKKESNNQPAVVIQTESIQKPTLLDILLQAQLDGKQLSNEDIQAEVKTFLFAGHETTATTLSFVMYLIAKHPNVQDKMWQEIKLNSLHVTNDRLTIRKLNSLSYMDNVIKETLRLYSPGVMVSKCCHEDIQVGHVFIPANTSVVTNIYSSHRLVKFFPDPEIFNPDRFANEISTEDRSSYAFQPFSSGLRSCLGQKFATLEMKTVLVKLLSNFELALADKDFQVDLIQTGTLRPRNGVPLKFKVRSNEM